MTYTIRPSTIHTIRPGDRHFQIQDKLLVAQRAGFEISKNCPAAHLVYITNAIDQGWLTPVAHITEREMIFLGLTNDN
jgi:hypothetical protein